MSDPRADHYNCEALIVTCIDYRFQHYIHEYLHKNFDPKTYDRVALAGAVQDFEYIMKQVDVSVRLHDIKRVVLINHENCGAYGEEGTIEKHSQDLKSAKEKILSKYPDLDVELYFLKLDGTFEKI